MISWNDLPFVLVILIIKTTKTNQKKLTIFVFLFFFFIVNFIIRIQRFLFLDFPNIFPTNGIFPIFFAAQQIRDYRFSIRVKTDIIDEIFRYSFFFFSFFHPPSRRFIVKRHEFPKVLSIFVAATVHFSGEIDFSLLCLCCWTINTRNFRSGWGQDGWNELLHRKINAPRVFRPTKHATVAFRHVCASRGRFFLFFFSRVRAWKPCDAKWWKKDRGGEVNENVIILFYWRIIIDL